MGLMQNYETVLEDDKKIPNITVEARGGDIKIVLNRYYLFNTLAQKEAILVAINDKLSELLQNHLQTMSDQELMR